MQPDPIRMEDTRGWLVKAGKDLRSAEREETGRQCVEIEPTLKDLVDKAVPLTEYAWKFRYPGGMEEPTNKEAEEALQISHEIYNRILAKLPFEVRP